MEEEKTHLEETPIQEPITKKDPKRVEQGKRLAAISKEAKEKKMREKIRREMESEKWDKKYYWYAFGGISLFGLIYLFTRKSKTEEEIKPVTIRRKSPEKKNFESFD